MSQIVVGIDGSPSAAHALAWAVTEAGLRHADVRAVFAWSPEGRPSAVEEQSPSFDADDMEKTSAALLRQAVAEAVRDTPSVKIVESLIYLDPVTALVDESRDASMLVVGARGIGGLKRALLGSVGLGCVQQADVPVVVVPDDPLPDPDKRPVVVGVDGSPSARGALRWAAWESYARGVPLRVIHARGGFTRSSGDAGARGMLELESAEIPGLDQRENVDLEVMAGPASRQLLAAAATAQLLVVGAHGHGGLTGVVLGSVSRECVTHATCPTAVIRVPSLQPLTP